MTTPIDIIINALWRGGPGVQSARSGVKSLGSSVDRTSIQIAAAAQRARLLDSRLAKLGEQVALGNITVRQAQRQYTEFAGGLTNVAEPVNKAAAGTVSLATKVGVAAAAFAGLSVAAKEAYQLMEEGAGLRLTIERFDRLAQSIGISGDALREDLAAATQGLLSQVEQMALATDFLGLELVETGEDAARLAFIVTSLGADLNEVTLAITNQSVRRFDQIGIAVAGFEGRLESLEAQGFSTQAAFTEAFLQQGEAQIERIGSVANTAAGDYQILRASFNDTFDQIKIGLSEAVEPIVGGLADMIRAAKSAQDAVANLKDEVYELGEAKSVVDDLAAAIREIGPIGSPFAPQAIVDTRNALLELTVELIRSAESQQEAESILRRYGFEVDELGARLAGLGISWIEINRAIDETNTMLEAAAADWILLNVTIAETGETVGLTTEEIIELAEEGRTAVEAWEAQREAVKRYGESLDELRRISTGELPDAIQAGLTQDAAREEARIEAERMGTRADLFADFQADLSDITQREEEQRRAITEQYEQQRTDIVEDYNQQRAREEEDWQRQRARQEADLRRNIADVREDAADAEADARAATNDRLADLERDHLKRMQDIIDNADEQLRDAASGLDARAVARIERQRDRALRDEQENYQEQRSEIEESLQEQLKSIRENMEERIEDLEEFHRDRQEREDEDRRIRLQRMEADHRRQLDELRQQEQRRLEQIRQAAARERTEREAQYREERLQLESHWRDRHDLEAAWMTNILRLEAEFWQARLGLVGGGESEFDPGNPPPIDGGGGGGGGPDPPNQAQLLNMATSLMADAGWPESVIFDELRRLRELTNEAIATWIEDTFDVDVPGYQMGTLFVPRSGPAMLHQGEAVLDAGTASLFRQGLIGGSQVTIEAGAIQVNSAPGMDEERLARLTRREIEALFREMAGT